MTRQRGPIPRGRLSAQERQLRSALHRILHEGGLLHGSLIARQRRCGKSGCRCTRGHPHESLYLIVTEAGKSRQMYVPRHWEPLVRGWIDNYAAARRLLNELSALHWDKVRRRKE